MSRVRPKLQAGKRSAAELAEELAQFDAILVKHHGEKTEDVAHVLMAKAMLCLQVTLDRDQGIKLLKQLRQDFPDTRASQTAQKILDSLDKQVAAEKLQASLTVGNPFPDFRESDLSGKPVSLADFKGKVVLIDFWATWCGPWLGELPHLLKVYDRHHAQGFEVIGVSLDDDKAKLAAFIQSNQIRWSQCFASQGWGNKLGEKYGIRVTPTSYLLDAQGNILARDLRGPALEAAVAKALGRR